MKFADNTAFFLKDKSIIEKVLNTWLHLMNRTITINRKTLFKLTWFEKETIFVTDLMDNKGLFLELDSFKEKYNIQCSYREYNKICQAIPVPLIQQIQNTLTYSRVMITLPDIKIGNIQIGEKKCNSKNDTKCVQRNSFQ